MYYSLAINVSKEYFVFLVIVYKSVFYKKKGDIIFIYECKLRQ